MKIALKVLFNATRGTYLASCRCMSYSEHADGAKYKKGVSSGSFLERNLRSGIKGELVYGIHPVRMALTARRRSFNCLYVNENVLESTKSEIVDILNMAENLSVPLSIQKNFVLSSLSEHRPHQGFCLDASKLIHRISKSQVLSELSGEDRLVILDNIQDPQNLGAILRSCYYFGYTKVLTGDKNCCALTGTVSKASSGALELMNVYSIQGLTDFLSTISGEWMMLGTSASNDTDNLTTDEVNKMSDKKVALVFGNEEKGVGDEMRALCQKHITIPPANHPNLIGCLNVSVATGIILHALKRPANQVTQHQVPHICASRMPDDGVGGRVKEG